MHPEIIKARVIDTEGEGDGLYPQKLHKCNVQCLIRVQGAALSVVAKKIHCFNKRANEFYDWSITSQLLRLSHLCLASGFDVICISEWLESTPDC